MSAPLIAVGPFLLFMIGTMIFSTFFMSSGKSEIFKMRKLQAKEFSSNTFRLRFKDYTDKKVEYSKREEIEILCQNAGVDLSYSDFILVSIGVAILLFSIFTFVIGNIFMGTAFAVIGYKLPKQILGFIKNKRIEKLETQLGPFMNMVIKRYEYTEDFEKAIINTAKEFYGTEPLYTELSKTVSEISVGVSIPEALDNLAIRTANKYMGLLADYYKIAYLLGTDEVRKKLLGQAYEQYEENRKLKMFLKEQISEPVRDSYMMVLAYPLFVGFGVVFMDGYTDFMFHTLLGQIVITACTLAVMGIVVFINKKIGAPLEKKYQKPKQSLESQDRKK